MNKTSRKVFSKLFEYYMMQGCGLAYPETFDRIRIRPFKKCRSSHKNGNITDTGLLVAY